MLNNRKVTTLLSLFRNIADFGVRHRHGESSFRPLRDVLLFAVWKACVRIFVPSSLSVTEAPTSHTQTARDFESQKWWFCLLISWHYYWVDNVCVVAEMAHNECIVDLCVQHAYEINYDCDCWLRLPVCEANDCDRVDVWWHVCCSITNENTLSQ